ncbi:MAG TPA: response regulator transcription factor [Candidatus Sulfotelmatobacter sp.]|jgi:DNA-binding response OmpR family regulator|nr:response regulator transcription factor [Candidatus Sulfotelmatobacter sp.]
MNILIDSKSGKIMDDNIQHNTMITDTHETIEPESKTEVSNQIHVLLIDDDNALCRLFGGYLEKAGFQVIYAHDGDEGREIARRLQPNIILLDLGLPGMDGYELSSRFKTEKLTKHIPLIILTNADVSKEAEGLLKQKGVADYIHKSVEAEELVERIRKVLQLHKE